jgi:hypothetical protein
VKSISGKNLERWPEVRVDFPEEKTATDIDLGWLR